MKSLLSFLKFFSFILLVISPVTYASENQIRNALRERMPDLPAIDEIRSTSVPGIYELRLGNELLYSDANGDYLFQGILFETKSKQNLTENRKEQLQKIPFEELPVKNAIKYTIGDGKVKLAVFADPNCGHCKRLEQELAKLDNVTIYYYLYPVLGDDSYNKATHVWCSKEQLKTWHDWMLNSKVPTHTNCEQKTIAENVALAARFRITGTPTLVLENGRRVVGAVSKDRLVQLMSTTLK